MERGVKGKGKGGKWELVSIRPGERGDDKKIVYIYQKSEKMVVFSYKKGIENS
jgi:hypothetical protein